MPQPHIELIRCLWCNKILSLDFTEDIINDMQDCKLSRFSKYFPMPSEGPIPILQHWILSEDHVEIWLKDNPSSDHFIYLRKNDNLENDIFFAAPDTVFCVWVSEELGMEIADKYFWAAVGAIIFEQLHGDGFHIENFLSWVARKNFGELIRSPVALST